MSQKSKLSLSLAAFVATLLVPAIAFAQQAGAAAAGAA